MKTRLRELRMANKITQAQAGAILGVKQRTYSYYENGEHDIPNQLLVQAADYFDVSTDYILFRTNNPSSIK